MRPQFVPLYESIKAGDLRPLQALSDAAYSENPPVPSSTVPETQSLGEIIGELVFDVPCISSIARFDCQPYKTFVWKPSLADDLEDFLYEKYEEEGENEPEIKIKKRVKALKKGASPSEDELEYLEQEYEEGWGIRYANPVYYLYKIDAPAKNNSDSASRSVYLLSAWAELGWNYADHVATYGPFLFLEAFIQWFRNTFGFDAITLYESDPVFQEKLQAVGIDVSKS